MNVTWLLDYDDTLAWNQHDYSVAQIAFLDFVVNRLGHHAPDCPTILKMEEEIDSNNISTLGFSMQRFPTSLKQVYEQICESANIDDKDGAKKAYEIGMLAFSEERYKKNGLVDGAAETLTFLKGQGDTLVLLSKGDLEIQKRKFRSTRIDKWFGNNVMYLKHDKIDYSYLSTFTSSTNTRVFITDKKTKDIFNYASDLNPNTITVGNGLKSDVEPSVSAGLKTIYIPCETWKFEKDHKLEHLLENSLVTSLDTITQIKDKYEELIKK